MAQDFWDEWPPDEGECRFCPPILAGTLGGEIEWGVEHVGFSIDEEIWNDLVELAELLIDKLPDGDPPEEEPPEEDPPTGGPEEPGGEPPDTPDGEESQSGGEYKGRVVTLVEPSQVPQIRVREGQAYAEYQLPRDALKVADKLVVEKAIRLDVAADGSAAVVVPKGTYPVSEDGILRFPLAFVERR